MLQRMKVERSMQTTCQVWGKSKTANLHPSSKSLQQQMGQIRKTSYCQSQAITSVRGHTYGPSGAARASGRYGWIRKSISPRALMLHGSVCATRHAGNAMAMGSVWKRLGSPDCAHLFVFSTAPFLNWSGITLEAGRSSLPVRIG